MTTPATRPASELATLLGETWTEISARPGPYLAAEVGRWLILVPALFAGWAVTVAAWFALGGGGALALWVIGLALGSQRRFQTLGGLVLIAGVGWLYGSMGLLLVVATPALLAAYCWLTLALHRAAALDQEGARPLSLGSSLQLPLWRIRSVGALVLAVLAVTLTTSVVPLIPVVLAALVGGFVVPVMALRDVGFRAASSATIQVLARDPGRFLRASSAALAVDLIAVHVPLAGSAFARSFRLRVTRALFEDEPAPATWPADQGTLYDALLDG